ncbi:radical SAM family heme chaperone HemW [uncultured Holdemanella sp.]|uniref:radical SAM family heme chaperone HemW n=1 Tax=uncultured Holdemanella sp. TaxID=1763549 RepID=UPI0026008C0F|nr:radical SAM family heme chaperone HemW [uncultured Holdemanella sp.]
MVPSCYVHIPFCDSICSYCDFVRIQKNEKFFSAWKDTLIKEIQEYKICDLHTLYFGGGTPSLLDVYDFKQIRNCFPSSIDEFTVECNPESLNDEKLKAYEDLGVNRISLGVQSFKDEILQVCNRRHTALQAISVIEKIKKSSIQTFSIDLIFGFPNQTMEDVKNDISMFLSLDIPHLSIYSLQIEENSVFGKKGIKPIDSDLEADMFEYITKTLEAAGYIHYEISSFCKPGHHSRHNLAYWQDQDFYGIGCGASGRLNGIRYDNTSSLKEYCSFGPCPTYISETLEERSMDAIMMALRTRFGLNISSWNARYQLDFKTKYANVLNTYRSYFEYGDDRIYLNDAGLEILNTILVDFMMIE